MTNDLLKRIFPDKLCFLQHLSFSHLNIMFAFHSNHYRHGCFYFRAKLSLIPGFLSVLVWVPPKANHKLRIWVQVTSCETILGDMARSWGIRHGEGNASEVGLLQKCSTEGQGSWGMNPLIHQHFSIIAGHELSGVSSPPLDQAAPAHSREGSNHH